MTDSSNTLFTGIETCWLFILGVLMYVQSTSCNAQPRDLSSGEFRKILSQFKTYLADLQDEYEYPRIGPSAKYGVASSRLGYLYSIVRWEDDLLQLLKMVVRLVSTQCSVYAQALIPLTALTSDGGGV